MRLSLVVCTRNRARQLETTLECLLRLENEFPWELLIVDNGSSDETSDVIAAYATRLPIRYIFESQPGSGRARNRGWRAALGEIVAFTDDDCYPATDYLAAVARAFAESRILGFVGGRVTLHDPRDRPITIRDVAEPCLFKPHEFIRAGLVHGANFAFRRTVLSQVDGFDDRFGAGTRFPCEDVDILARVLACGWHGAYDPRVVVAHHHGRRTQEDVNKLTREYDRARGAYYVKCILNPTISYISAKNWYWSMLSSRRVTTIREVMAAIEFVVRYPGDTLRSLSRAVFPAKEIDGVVCPKL